MKRMLNLPIGYQAFHKDKFLNYPLNRWHSLGDARKEDMEMIAKKIKGFASSKLQMKYNEP